MFLNLDFIIWDFHLIHALFRNMVCPFEHIILLACQLYMYGNGLMLDWVTGATNYTEISIFIFIRFVDEAVGDSGFFCAGAIDVKFLASLV